MTDHISEILDDYIRESCRVLAEAHRHMRAVAAAESDQTPPQTADEHPGWFRRIGQKGSWLKNALVRQVRDAFRSDRGSQS